MMPGNWDDKSLGVGWRGNEQVPGYGVPGASLPYDYFREQKLRNYTQDAQDAETARTSELGRADNLIAELRRLTAAGVFDSKLGAGTKAGNWSDAVLRSETPDEESRRSRQGWKDLAISMIPGGQTYMTWRDSGYYPERKPDYAKTVLGDMFNAALLWAPGAKAAMGMAGPMALGHMGSHQPPEKPTWPERSNYSTSSNSSKQAQISPIWKQVQGWASPTGVATKLALNYLGIL